MTNQEAIDLLDNLIGMIEDNHGSDYDSAIRMAIDALESKWIPVSERLPEERDSIFAKLYGTEKWRNAMFRKISNTVIITVEFKDGTRQTAPCYTIDGEWNQSMKGMGKALAWMPLPEPYKEGNDEIN